MSKHVTFCDWDSVPHLSDTVKAAMLAALPPHQRDARSKGVPQLGSGAIYPVLESDIKVTDFPIPAHWPRAYGMDVGWRWTAACWEARDPETGIRYIYSVYKRGYAEPSIHSSAILARGSWIPGDIDPAAQGRSQEDGEQLIEKYKALGLDLDQAPHAVESGLYETFNLLSTGMLKVFGSCGTWFEEYRIYRRDDKGRVVKQNDHLMDCTRYRVLTGIQRMKAVPVDAFEQEQQRLMMTGSDAGADWMGM